MTDQYIYTIYDGRKFKDIMKLADAYQQGGKILRISTHEGDVVKTYVLDRPIAGIYVDEGFERKNAWILNWYKQTVQLIKH